MRERVVPHAPTHQPFFNKVYDALRPSFLVNATLVLTTSTAASPASYRELREERQPSCYEDGSEIEVFTAKRGKS